MKNSDYELVAKAIRYLGDTFQTQPSLDDLADALGVGKYHLQRTFTQWAGVSPKRFLQFLTLEHAKDLLRESEPILTASFESGLSGPSRLHDLFVTVEGVTPGEFKRGGSSVTIGYGSQDTPFGPAFLGFTRRGLCHLRFLTEDTTNDRDQAVATLQEEWPAGQLRPDPEKAAELVSSIFPSGQRLERPKPLSLLLKGTNFQIKVWTALLRIPPGHVASYGQLASLMGKPRSARAVGSAVGRNPIAFLIPCHRVIRASGAFGQYRWGDLRKRVILGWEQAQWMDD